MASQKSPLVRKGLQQHLEGLFRFLVAHPEAVTNAQVFITVREPAHLPVLLGDDYGDVRLMGQGDLHVSVALAPRTKEPAPQSPGLDTPRALLPAPEDEP